MAIRHGPAKDETETEVMAKLVLLLSILFLAIGVTLPSYAGSPDPTPVTIGAIAGQHSSTEGALCAVPEEEPRIAVKRCGKAQGKLTLPCDPDRCLPMVRWTVVTLAAARVSPPIAKTELTGALDEPSFRPPRT